MDIYQFHRLSAALNLLNNLQVSKYEYIIFINN